ncbi:MAG: F0F1 ATP synthase subunit A [Thermomicrobiales bacterium]
MNIHISIAAETLFTIGPVRVTNSMFTMFIVMALLIIIGALIARGAKIVPGRWQGLFEVVADFILTLVESTGGKSFGRKIFPLIGSIFIFIAIANYTGILPGVGTIYLERPAPAEEQTEAAHSGEVASLSSDLAATAIKPAAEEAEHIEHVPLFRPPNADLNMTLAMALITFTSVQILGIRAHGIGGRIKHMADPPFIFPIELVSEFSRIISLSARLFGNVLAGEILLGVMYAMANALKIAIVPLLFPVIFIFLELLFGTIQALVFALLTTIYIVMASTGGHDDHDAHAAADGHHGKEGVAPAPAGD